MFFKLFKTQFNTYYFKNKFKTRRK